jgi:hypothetical protein
MNPRKYSRLVGDEANPPKKVFNSWKINTPEIENTIFKTDYAQTLLDSIVTDP